MNKWIIGKKEAIRESDIHKIEISEEPQDKELYEGNLFMATAYDKKGKFLSVLSCEVGKEKFIANLNTILNGGSHE